MERVPDLLTDLGWLHELSRRLLDDPELAADAVQDTCAVALAQGDAHVAHPRAWLATVLRNCARLRRRSHRNAFARDRGAARPESSGEDTAELVARAELQRRLVDAVLALPAAHRDVVLMRFFDELPPRAIASRLQAPVATIHSRLQRALAQLRRTLDEDTGGRAGWAAIAVSLPASSSFLPVAGFIMQTKIKIMAALCVVAGTLTFFWPQDVAGEGGEAPVSRTQRDSGDAGEDRGRTTGAGAGGASGRRLVEERREPAPRTELRLAVRGFVRNCAGLPLRGAKVVASGDAGCQPAVTDAGGVFELQLLPTSNSLKLDGEEFVTVLGAHWSPDSSFEPVIVAAPAIRLAGIVADASGARLPRAELTMALPDDFDSRLSMRLDRTERAGFKARSDESGEFRFSSVPQIAGAKIVVLVPAFRPLTIDVPLGGDEAMQLVMEPFAYQEGQLEGIVVDIAGLPVAGARVAMGVTAAITDREGQFALHLRRAGWPTAITAAKPGYLPGRVEVPRGGGERREDWPARIVLRLGLEPMKITGYVRDPGGAPIPGALVWIADPTLLGVSGVMPMYVEYVCAGGDVPARAAMMSSPLVDEPARDDLFISQSSPVGQPTAGWWFVSSDDSGAFEVGGLLARDYIVRAFDPQSGLTTDRSAVPAGTSVELTVSREGLSKQVRGRVVSLRGEPLAGVDVALIARLYSANERVPGGRFEGNALHEVGKTRSGADGWFEFEGVARERASFNFSSDAILPRMVRVETVTDPASFVVQVEARCHVEVALTDPSEADEISAFDGDGEQVDIVVLHAGSHQANTEIALHGGKSGVFVLGESAVLLRLLREGQVVREVPLSLRAGETFRVQ